MALSLLVLVVAVVAVVVLGHSSLAGWGGGGGGGGLYEPAFQIRPSPSVCNKFNLSSCLYGSATKGADPRKPRGHLDEWGTGCQGQHAEQRSQWLAGRGHRRLQLLPVPDPLPHHDWCVTP